MTEDQMVAEIRAAVHALNNVSRTAARYGYEVEIIELPTHSLETNVRGSLYNVRVTKVVT